MGDTYSKATAVRHRGVTRTSQQEPMPGREEEMVANSEGGFVFALDDWARLRRFLILGSDAGSYYASPSELTKDNAKVVASCLKKDGERVVWEIVSISDAGNAPRNTPALLALAMACSPKYADPDTVKLALGVLPKVARIGTHVLKFAEYVNGFRGWGRGLRRAIANWFEDQPPDKLAYQAVKYAQREGWALRDLMRLAHPELPSMAMQPVFQYIAHPADAVLDPKSLVATIDVRERGEKGERTGRSTKRELPKIITGAVIASQVSAKDMPMIVAAYRLPREAVPTEALNDPKVWEALLYQPMPMTAMIRNLGKMSSIGLLKPLSRHSKFVAGRLADAEELKKARVHPLAVLVASKIYEQGHGMKGSLSWTPDPLVAAALDRAFYLAFAAVQPSGVGHYLGIDVSSSMGWATSMVANSPLTAAEAAAAMAMVQVETEPFVYAAGFSSTMKELGFRKGMTLEKALTVTRGVSFGGTDCAVPMLHAIKEGIVAQVFVVYTDNETHHGGTHPKEALDRYRQKTGIPARLVVCGMVSNGFTIADPKDAGMLDVVGFDSSVPAMIADFATGFAVDKGRKTEEE